MKQTTTTRAMINAAINALCAGANDRIKYAPVEKGYQCDRVIIAVYHKGARKPFNTALVMVDTFRGIVHTADMIVIAPEYMDAYKNVKAVKITAADVAEFVEPAEEQTADTEETEAKTTEETAATTDATTDTDTPNATTATEYTRPAYNWTEADGDGDSMTEAVTVGAGTPRTLAAG